MFPIEAVILPGRPALCLHDVGVIPPFRPLCQGILLRCSKRLQPSSHLGRVGLEGFLGR